MKQLGWEGCWSGISLLLLCMTSFVPLLSTQHWMVWLTGVNSFLCGGLLALLYFAEIGKGRTWLGGILPLALAGWGLYLIRLI